MTKTKTTKRALLSSVLALFLCVAMLVGTTFAWFTDSVTSANNIIKSGNLDIELDYWDKDAKAWKTVKGSSEILDKNALWEPGYTDVVYLRVSNKGSLALKYQLGINIVKETAGVNVAGETFKLSDYIYFDIEEGVNAETDAYATRDEAMEIATETKKISAGYTKASALEAKADTATEYPAEYVAMVVYMPTTVGNVANHNGTDVPQIELGINVMATQDTVEADSFDEYYDGAAGWYGAADTSWYDPAETEITLGSAEELAGLAAIVNGTASVSTYSARSTATKIVDDFAGKTITLASDIDLKNIAWTPIGNWDNAFCGTFDGNGHTISNLYINDPAGEGIGFFGVTEGSTIKGITLENVNIDAYSMVAALVGATYPANISDCHVIGDVEIVAEWAYVAGIAGYCYYGTQVADCSVVADDMGAITSKTRNAVGGITAWLLEGKHNVTNCTVKNLNLTGWTNIGGITGFVHYNNTIDGCTVENVNLTKTRVDGNPGIGLIAGGYSYSASNAITLTNNTVNKATLNGTHVAYDGYDFVYGSEYGGAVTKNFVLENNKTDNITNKLVEVIKISDGIINNNGVYQIYNANGLVYAFANLKAGNVLEIVADLDMTGKTITPVKGNKGFTMYGNGHTISNLNTTAAALFVDHSGSSSYTFDSVVLENCSVTSSTNYAALFVGDGDTSDAITITNCVVKNCNVTSAKYAAAFVAYTAGYNVVNNGPVYSDVLVENCSVIGGSITGGGSVGAAIGHAGGNVDTTTTVKNFTVDGVAINGEDAEHTGAIVGTAHIGETIINNSTYKNVTGNYNGLYGRFVPNSTGTLVIDGVVGVTDIDSLRSALKAGKDVFFCKDITATAVKGGYSVAGIVVDKGQTVDGNGYKFTVNGANDTYGSGIYLTNGTVKNITVAGSFRGIFMAGASADVYMDNVKFDGVVYTFNSDGGSKEYGVYISNSVLDGWTSFSDVHHEVVFTDCTFTGENNGYWFCRPYNVTAFVNCDFDEGFTMEPLAKVTFEGCTIGGVALTADNLDTLVTSSISNATVIK